MKSRDVSFMFGRRFGSSFNNRDNTGFVLMLAWIGMPHKRMGGLRPQPVNLQFEIYNFQFAITSHGERAHPDSNRIAN
jgi:hypothetical protein